MRRLLIIGLIWWNACVGLLPLSAQSEKTKVQCALPMIEVKSCDIPEKGATVIFKRTKTPIKDKEYTNSIMVEYGFFINKSGTETPMRFANNKALITPDQYEELPEAKLLISFDKTQIKFDLNGLNFDDQLTNGEVYEKSVKNFLREVFKRTNLARSENKIYTIIYPNRRVPKEPLEISVGLVPTENDECYEVLFDPQTKPTFSHLFAYIDIDNCENSEVFISNLKDTLDSVIKGGGKYFIYLSNPSKDAYSVRSSEIGVSEEMYEEIFAQIRRIEPGRAKIENDIDALKEEITRTVKNAKSKGLKPEELRFMFILPSGTVGATHKTKWEEVLMGNAASTNKGIFQTEKFAIKPVFYDCSFELLP